MKNSLKMCANAECPENFMVKYKVGDMYCKKCGQPLVYVCKQCKKTILPDGSQLICDTCKEKNEANKQKAVDLGKQAIAIAPTAIGKGKELLKNPKVRDGVNKAIQVVKPLIKK